MQTIESQAQYLSQQQNLLIKSLQKDLERFVLIESINLETKQLFCINKKDTNPYRLRKRLMAILAKEVGSDACHWQIKISGEKNGCL